MSQPLLLAVLGDPVEHSLSPRIHSAFGQQFGLSVDYRKIQTTPEQLVDRLKQLSDAGAQGVNLTVPLKGTGIRLCQYIDGPARRARAVNTLHWQDNGWSGHNTDGPGLRMDLERLGVTVADRRVLILGAGGATAGILGPLLDADPAAVLLLNRTPERAEEMAERFAHLGPIAGAGLEAADRDPRMADFDLLIQATSAGHDSQLPLLRRNWLKREASIYDLNYGPAHNALLRWATAFDLPCHDGLGMLVGQAALAFEIWTGQRPALEPVLERLR
ncbi:MAG: shikimate dehydrogenase [Pseudomonadota bacterium]